MMFYLRVKSLPGNNPKPTFGPIMDPTAAVKTKLKNVSSATRPSLLRRQVGPELGTWNGRCMRRERLEKWLEHYLTNTHVSGFQSRVRPSYECSSRYTQIRTVPGSRLGPDLPTRPPQQTDNDDLGCDNGVFRLLSGRCAVRRSVFVRFFVCRVKS